MTRWKEDGFGYTNQSWWYEFETSQSAIKKEAENPELLLAITTFDKRLRAEPNVQ